MRNIFLSFVIILFSVMLSSCGDKKSPRLEGKRITILKHDVDTVSQLKTRYYPVTVPAEFNNMNWPQTAGYPTHVMENLSLDNPAQLKKSWSKSIGQGNSTFKRILGQPIVVEDVIYTIDTQSNVMAHNFLSGEKLWHRKLKSSFEKNLTMGGGLAFAEDFLIATTGSGEVIAMDPQTGEDKWRKRLSAPVRIAPLIVSGRVFIVTATNKTYALTLYDGAEIWNHVGLSENSEILGGAVPAATTDAVIIPYSSGEIFALRQVNGIPVWQESLSGIRYTDISTALADILANPVVLHNIVLVSSHNGKFSAIDVRLGKELWSLPIALDQMPWVAGDIAYGMSSKGDLIALTADKGEIIWVKSFPLYKDLKKQKNAIEWFGPIMGDGIVWIAGSTNKLLIGVSPQTGEEVYRYKLSGEPAQAPIIADNKLVIITKSGKLEIYEAASNLRID